MTVNVLISTYLGVLCRSTDFVEPYCCVGFKQFLLGLLTVTN